MMPFFPMDDFGRLALRDLLAALVSWRKACCWVRSDGKTNRSPPRGVSECFLGTGLFRDVLDNGL